MVNYRRPLGNEFLDITPKAQSMKKKFYNLDFIKIRNFCSKIHYKGNEKISHRLEENNCKMLIL